MPLDYNIFFDSVLSSNGIRVIAYRLSLSQTLFLGSVKCKLILLLLGQLIDSLFYVLTVV